MSLYSRDQMEHMAQRSKEILVERPDFYAKSTEDIGSELDDGTQDMKQVQCGVAARVIISTIDVSDTAALVRKLSKNTLNNLICVNVGYLLVTEYNLILEQLLLEADAQDEFDGIAPFVSQSLQFEPVFYNNYLRPFLAMLEHHRASKEYFSLINGLVELIICQGAQPKVAELLGDLSNETEFILLREVSYNWSSKANGQLQQAIEKLLSYPGIWSKKAGITLCEATLWQTEEVFLKLYPQIEPLLLNSRELWITAIPMLVMFVSKNSRKNRNKEIYDRVLSHLSGIPNGAPDERLTFMSAVNQEDVTDNYIDSIFRNVISVPFSKDSGVLNMLNLYLCRKLQKHPKNIHDLLDTMFAAFSASQLGMDFGAFFETVSASTNLLTNKFTFETVSYALKTILSGGMNQLCFGLGLLSEIGDDKHSTESCNNPKVNFPYYLTDEQLIYIMKGFFYITHDSENICCKTFEFLLLSQDDAKKYRQFCMEEVFENFPTTLNAIAEGYLNSVNIAQQALAKNVKMAYETTNEARKEVLKIKDILPSHTHLLIYQETRTEMMQQIEKNRKSSFFFDLFQKKALKFGSKIGFVTYGMNDEMAYRVSTPAHFSQSMEIPTEYVTDPVTYAMKRQDYFMEVKNRASDNQGLSLEVERKG